MPRYKGPVSDHFNGRKFTSPYGNALKSPKDIFRWKVFGEGAKKWPKWVEGNLKAQPAREVVPGEAVVTFINHATLLLQVNGLNILTDPVFSKRTSPFQFAGPARVRAPGMTYDELPKIDLVLVSHNHYDHLDVASIRELQKRFDPYFLFALGDGEIVKGISGLRFREMDWWQSFEMNGSKMTFLPAQHWSARGTRDQNQSLWGSFMIEAPGYLIYFAGDTGYAPHFREIRAKFPPIDLALLPIGAYEPQWFMREMHTNPADAVKAHLDLGAKQSIGIHFGTWQLADEGFEQPVEELAQARLQSGLSPEQFMVLQQGETRRFHSRK